MLGSEYGAIRHAGTLPRAVAAALALVTTTSPVFALTGNTPDPNQASTADAARIAVTGAVRCLLFLLMTVPNPLIFAGKLMAALPAAMNTYPLSNKYMDSDTLLPLADLRERAAAAAKARGLDDSEPAYLKLRLAGNASVEIQIAGASPRSLAPLGAVALDATRGDVLRAQLPGRRNANHAILGTRYALLSASTARWPCAGCISCSGSPVRSCSTPATCCG